MRFQHVCVESIGYVLPGEVVTSAQIEERLAPVYDRLGLSVGRLELMTGIRERRFFPPGTLPSQVARQAGEAALSAAGISRDKIGAALLGSVCRDHLEPATANAVHHGLGLPAACDVLDLSNACLGLLNGVLYLAAQIELGHIAAGIVFGGEIGRPLVEGTIDSLNRNLQVTRQTIKNDFASLTIGSGGAAIVLCDRRLSRTQSRLRAAVRLSDTSAHTLCAGGSEAAVHGDDRPRMVTDSEALLHAGVALAQRAWPQLQRAARWPGEAILKTATHQVGKAHRRLLLDALHLPLQADFPTVETLGNTGAVALPTAAAVAVEQGHVVPGDHWAWLGIGSGLNTVMLAIDYQGFGVAQRQYEG